MSERLLERVRRVRAGRAGLVAALAVVAVLVAGLLVLTARSGDGERAFAGPVATPTATATPTPTKAPEFNAVAKEITDSADLIGGPMSRGRIGDYLLANGEIQVVIQQPQRNLLSVGQFGGQIIDADLVRGTGDPERDSFEEWAFGINIENTAHYTDVVVINDGSDGQPAVLRATGVDDLLDFINASSQVVGFGFTLPAQFDDTDLPVEISTDYILAPNNRYVEVVTTVTNVDTSETIETFLLDFLSGSGQVEIFRPGYGFGETLLTAACDACDLIAYNGVGDAEGVSYGYIYDIADSTTFSDSGVAAALLGANAAGALLGVAAPNFVIDPLDSVSVTRYFAVGDGDVGAVVDIRNEILGLTTGTLSGTVTRGGSPVEGADVTVLGAAAAGPGTPKNVVASYETDASGDYAGTLPPGDYTVQAQLDGHLAASPDPANVTITADTTTDQDFTIPAAGRAQVTIVDESNAAIAGKVSLVGFDQYPDPGNTSDTALFGDVFIDGLPFGLAQVLFVDDSGDSGEFFIEPGQYHVVVSHGPRYSIYEETINVTSGNLTAVNAQIAKVIDTSGFVSGDFHVHQLDSPDSEVTYEERVISMLAEGVDFFTPSDHEHRSDLAPTVSSLGMENLISVAPNAETTTADYGHFNAWPMTLDPSKVNNGAIDWAGAAPAGEDFPSFGNYALSPAEIFAALKADPGIDTVQINHINSFFGPGGLDIDTAYQPPQHFADAAAKRLDPLIPNLFDDGFTALEVWQGTDRNDILDRFIARNLGDWFNMINQGIIRTGIAVSDTHKTIKNQAGFPRTMLASSVESPGGLDDVAESLASNVNDGRVTGTNGPFLTVTSSAASTGEAGGLALGEPTLISTTDGEATISVEVHSPLWAEFDRIEYYVSNVPFPDDTDDDPTTPPFYPVTPEAVQVAGTDFTISVVDDFPSIPGAEHLEASTSLDLSGLTEDTWVVVVVRGTDGVSEPLFPVVPNDLDETGNTTVADLADGNLGESGVLATAFANPLFIDVDGNAAYDPPPVDNDQDGCTNDRELGPNEALGGRRSPSNPWDFFNPSGDLRNRVDDILLVVAQFGIDEGEPGYTETTDRTSLGPEDWNLGPPNGLQRVDDILSAVAQFGHDCV